jgi:anti-sigma factor (TIGR02949 family)
MIDQKRGGGAQNGGQDGDEIISCAEAVAKVYEYLDGELASPDREQVREHVRLCKKCYPFFDFERAFLDFIRERGFADKQSEELLQKVLITLREVD